MTWEENFYQRYCLQWELVEIDNQKMVPPSLLIKFYFSDKKLRYHHQNAQFSSTPASSNTWHFETKYFKRGNANKRKSILIELSLNRFQFDRERIFGNLYIEGILTKRSKKFHCVFPSKLQSNYFCCHSFMIQTGNHQEEKSNESVGERGAERRCSEECSF